MVKKLDLNKTVFELTQQYPELVDIMVGLGFTEMKKKPMLNSVGKMMTIPKGAKMKKISMIDIVTTLMHNGFDIVGDMPEMASVAKVQEQEKTSRPSSERREQLKAYLKRLGDGEALEEVRKDFVRDFTEVEASEIMEAEQELLKEGTPLSEVQRLCDVHSALFHGSTTEEKIANAEKEVEASVLRKKAQEAGQEKKAKSAVLEEIPGHPLSTLKKENEALSALLTKFKESRDESVLPQIRELSIHYAKKGDLLYPLLKVHYGISGPSDVMWTVDDEIRDALAFLAKEKERGDEWYAELDAALTRAEEMIYKEENILFPICADNFSEEEWYGIYRDAKDYATCFGVEREKWVDAEKSTEAVMQAPEGEIVMPGGRLKIEELTALLNTIPMEITFVDAENINRFFDEGPKVFKRPLMALNREVFACHPPKIEPMVRQIIDDFRQGRRDFVEVWMEKEGRTMLVRYMAVRDKGNKYLGTLELVQDMEFAKEHFLGDKA